MLKRINQLSPEARSYIIIGSFVYIFELIVIVLAQALGANGVQAVAAGFWSGLALSFVLQKMITFKDKRLHHKVLLPQIFVYSLLVIFNFSFVILFTKYSAPPLPVVGARTFALGLTTVWNFYLYRTKIFRGTDKVVF